jgi:ABC-type polysaccharide transport system permease subunit
MKWRQVFIGIGLSLLRDLVEWMGWTSTPATWSSITSHHFKTFVSLSLLPTTLLLQFLMVIGVAIILDQFLAAVLQAEVKEKCALGPFLSVLVI